MYAPARRVHREGMTILHLWLDYQDVDPWAETEWTLALHPAYGDAAAAHAAIARLFRANELVPLVEADGSVVEIHPGTVVAFAVWEAAGAPATDP